MDEAIVFRTQPGSVPAAAAGNEVAFEVDHVDEALSRGWSVLAVGPASTVTEPDAVRELARRAHTETWAAAPATYGCRSGPHTSPASASPPPTGGHTDEAGPGVHDLLHGPREPHGEGELRGVPDAPLRSDEPVPDRCRKAVVTVRLPLVVGVDGSGSSLEAVDWAVDEAARLGLPLRIVHASLWERYETRVPSFATGRPAEEVMADNIVAAGVERARLRRRDLEVSGDVVSEDAVSALLHAAHDASTLVTGSRGRAGSRGCCSAR